MDQIFNIKFVNEIEKHPVLYDYRLVSYSNKDVSGRAWNEVAKEVNLTVNECMDKWMDIRSLFAHYIESSSSVTQNEKHYLTDAMKFTLPFIKLLGKPIINHTPTSSVTRKSSHLTQDMSDMAKDEEYSQSAYPKVNLPPPPPLLPLHPTQKFEKKMLQTESDIEDANVAYLNKKMEKVNVNSNKYNQKKVMFLLSLIPEIEPLTAAQMKLIRRKFLQDIDDVTSPTPQCHSLPSNSHKSSTDSHSSSQSSLSIDLGPDYEFQNLPSDDQISINTQEFYYEIAREVMDDLEKELQSL